MDDAFRELLTKAESAAGPAYAPYSNYHVGASELTEKGVFTEANIENASSNLGICAERVAIGHARMNGATEIQRVAICCRDVQQENGVVINRSETMPCGGCRQWLFELARYTLLVSNGSDEIITVADLLPHGFTLNQKITTLTVEQKIRPVTIDF